MLTETTLEYIEKHIFQMIITIRKNFILFPEIQDLRCLIRALAGLELESAGTSGFLKQQELWHLRELR